MPGRATLGLAQTDLPARGFDEFRRVVTNAVLEHGFDFLDVFYIRGRISLYHDDIGQLADRQRADSIQLTEKLRAIRSGDVNRLHGRKPRFHEQFHLALVTRSLIVSRMGPLATSSPRSALFAAAGFGHSPGFLSGKNSVSATKPCSKSSMPRAAASRKPMEQRWPVTLIPRA